MYAFRWQIPRCSAALVWFGFTDSQVLLLISDGSELMTTKFTRELLFLQVNHSDVLSGIRFSSVDFLTAETEPLVAGELLYSAVDVSRVYIGQLQARIKFVVDHN